MKRTSIFFLLCILIVGSALYTSRWRHHGLRSQQTAPQIQGFVLSPPRMLKKVHVRLSNREYLKGEHFKNKWSILYFGYARCPEICPRNLRLIAQTLEILRTEKIQIQPYFVSIDPTHDRDLKELHRFVTHFDAQFLGITGHPEEIQAFSSQFYVVRSAPDAQGQIDHSTSVVLVNPKGEFVALFSPPFEAKKLAHELQSVIRKSGDHSTTGLKKAK